STGSATERSAAWAPPAIAKVAAEQKSNELIFIWIPVAAKYDCDPIESRTSGTLDIEVCDRFAGSIPICNLGLPRCFLQKPLQNCHYSSRRLLTAFRLTGF